MSVVHSHKKVWWKEAVFYQIYPSSFQDSNGDGVGDLRGIINRLDYLKDLGVDAIWVSPHYSSPEKDMGYDISDYQGINTKYGTMADCDELIEGCHKRGMKIVFDLVINHSSDQHKWFQESRKSRDNPFRDYYMWRDPKGYKADGTPIPPSNWKAAFGGSAWEWDAHTKQYYLHLFDAGQPDINWESEPVRKHVYKEAITFWLDKGVDGFRIDTVNLYSKRLDFPDAPVTDQRSEWQDSFLLWINGPRLHEFLREMAEEAFIPYSAVTIGEAPSTNDPKDVLQFVSEKEKKLSMVFQFAIAMIDRDGWGYTPQDWDLSTLKKLVNDGQQTISKNDGWTTNYLENHDQSRSVSRYTSDLPEYRVAAAKMLAVYLLTLTGTTFIYQGEEIGMVNAPLTYPIDDYLDISTIGWWTEYKQNHQDDPKALRRGLEGIQALARDHGRLPMQWSSEIPNGGFTVPGVAPWQKMNPYYQEINVADQIDKKDSVLSFYKQMLALRKKHNDVFAYGQFRLLDPEDEKVMMWIKDTSEEKPEDNQALVVMNWTKEKVEWTMPINELKGQPRLVLSNFESPENTLEPFEARIYFTKA